MTAGMNLPEGIRVTMTIRAVYEGGVLRPVEPLGHAASVHRQSAGVSVLVGAHEIYEGRLMAKKGWIAGAVKHKGALTAQAKKAGQSPMAFARAHKGSPGKTGQRARLALTLWNFHHKGRS